MYCFQGWKASLSPWEWRAQPKWRQTPWSRSTRSKTNSSDRPCGRPPLSCKSQKRVITTFTIINHLAHRIYYMISMEPSIINILLFPDKNPHLMEFVAQINSFPDLHPIFESILKDSSGGSVDPNLMDQSWGQSGPSHPTKQATNWIHTPLQ